MFEERRSGGTWESPREWTPSDYEPETPEAPNTYGRRSYGLFSVLAGVRNGVGFAGCDMGDAIQPIAEPRGLPTDCDPRIRAQSAQWGADGHSHSWLTVAELMAFDWTQRATRRGIVNGPEFFAWARWREREGKPPESYCGGITGPGITHVGRDEMEAMIAEVEAMSDGYRDTLAEVTQQLDRVYTKVEWGQMCSTLDNGTFWSETMPYLLQLGAPDDVRTVFWFDN
jgi:hypothetical protein